MVAEPMTTQPGRDWLDLSSPPQPPPEPSEAPAPSRIPAVRNGLSADSFFHRLAQVRTGAARAGSAAAGVSSRCSRPPPRPCVGLRPSGRRRRSASAPILSRPARPAPRGGPGFALGARPAARRFGSPRRRGPVPRLVCARRLPPLGGRQPSPRTLTVQSEDGTPIARRGVERGRALRLESVSPAMRQAFLAAQDPWFEDGYRLDASGVAAVIGRAFRDTISDGPRSGGPRA